MQVYSNKTINKNISVTSDDSLDISIHSDNNNKSFSEIDKKFKNSINKVKENVVDINKMLNVF